MRVERSGVATPKAISNKGDVLGGGWVFIDFFWVCVGFFFLVFVSFSLVWYFHERIVCVVYVCGTMWRVGCVC